MKLMCCIESDLGLLKLVQDFLRGAGRPLAVQTGRYMFKGNLDI